MSEVLIYEIEAGKAGVDVRLDGETVWLSLGQMSELFQRDKSVISRHIGNLFKEGELTRDSVVANFATTAADGKSYQVEYFNLDVIISVGYRVNSKRGVQFRQWATRVLREHLVFTGRGKKKRRTCFISSSRIIRSSTATSGSVRSFSCFTSSRKAWEHGSTKMR